MRCRQALECPSCACACATAPPIYSYRVYISARFLMYKIDPGVLLAPPDSRQRRSAVKTDSAAMAAEEVESNHGEDGERETAGDAPQCRLCTRRFIYRRCRDARPPRIEVRGERASQPGGGRACHAAVSYIDATRVIGAKQVVRKEVGADWPLAS
jgi:hypothetical protein